jgi:hypothetical protein
MLALPMLHLQPRYKLVFGDMRAQIPPDLKACGEVLIGFRDPDVH